MATIQDILRHIRLLDLRTSELSMQMQGGNNISHFKGRGMEFSEIREYHPGDEVRFIDWNTSARYGETFVKVFDEEREQIVFLLVDVSGSSDIADFGNTKREIEATVAATIAISALKMRDRTGFLLFSDKTEKLIRPVKSKPQLLAALKDILEFRPSSPGTNIALALKEIMRTAKRRCKIFILSDFLSGNFDRELEICSQHHAVTAVRICTPNDEILPSVGMLSVIDSETGERKIIDTSTIHYRSELRRLNKNQDEKFIATLTKRKVHFLDITTADDCVNRLAEFFATSKQ